LRSLLSRLGGRLIGREEGLGLLGLHASPRVGRGRTRVNWGRQTPERNLARPERTFDRKQGCSLASAGLVGLGG